MTSASSLKETKKCTACKIEYGLDQFYKKSGEKGHRSKCMACTSNGHRSYYQKNKDTILKKAAEDYRQDSRKFIDRVQRYRKSGRGSHRNRSLKYRLAKRISGQLRRCLRGGKLGNKTAELVGWSADELKSHLERQFVKGMTWENMSEWHIDHIVPLSSFDIDGPESKNIKTAWALTNLRPIWARENMKKHARRIFLV
jgi:hypothetical protein